MSSRSRELDPRRRDGSSRGEKRSKAVGPPPRAAATHIGRSSLSETEPFEDDGFFDRVRNPPSIGVCDVRISAETIDPRNGNSITTISFGLIGGLRFDGVEVVEPTDEAAWIRWPYLGVPPHENPAFHISEDWNQHDVEQQIWFAVVQLKRELKP